MIRQIWNILQDYKSNKAWLDDNFQERQAKELRELNINHYNNDIKPKREQAYNAQTRCLKGAALSQIEQIAENAENYVNSAINTVNYYLILEASSLKDVPLTDREINALYKHYSANTYALRIFINILNDRSDPLHQRPIPYPEDTLNVINDVLRDSALLINAYSGVQDMTTQEGVLNYISAQTIEARFLDYEDRLDKTCFSDQQLDIPVPLTAAEEKEVNSLFKGCTTLESKNAKAAELAKKGYANLISRSEYADNLPRFYKDPMKLSDIAENAVRITDDENGDKVAKKWAIQELGEYVSLLDDSAEDKNAFDVLSQWAIDHGFSVSLDVKEDQPEDNASEAGE